jgi:hypothetical protein
MEQGTPVAVKGAVGVHGGATHPHAASRLRQSFPNIDWFDADQMPIPDGVASIRLTTDPLQPEGGFTITVDAPNGVPSITVSGGPFSGVIYGVEELIQRRTTATGTGFTVDRRKTIQTPGLPYRAFWTWDHTTNWDLDQIGHQEIGVTNSYAKPPDGFLADYKRMIDFMSQHRIAAVTIYGFFRDTHGGVEAAQELCRYANQRGVRILPGIAINAYGGIYWDGNHHYNLATWLRAHPELAAEMERPAEFQINDLAFPLFFDNDVYMARGCSSRLENQRWMEEGVAWLAESCDIGGLNIEAGDYGICVCPYCQRRRAEREEALRRDNSEASWSPSDMTDFFPRLAEIAHATRPDLWVYAEIQWDQILDAAALAPLQSLPDSGIYQYTFNRTYWQRTLRELTPEHMASVPTKTNVFRAQFCSQWNGDRRTERYRFNGRDLAEMVWKAAACGMQGVTMFGEVSPFETATELSYLAFARFSYDPSLTWDQFLTEEVAPRLGGDTAATRFLELVTTLDAQPNLGKATLRRIQSEALDAARHPDDEVSRRWLWLATKAAKRAYLAVS